MNIVTIYGRLSLRMDHALNRKCTKQLFQMAFFFQKRFKNYCSFNGYGSHLGIRMCAYFQIWHKNEILWAFGLRGFLHRKSVVNENGEGETEIRGFSLSPKIKTFTVKCFRSCMRQLSETFKQTKHVNIMGQWQKSPVHTLLSNLECVLVQIEKECALEGSGFILESNNEKLFNILLLHVITTKE